MTFDNGQPIFAEPTGNTASVDVDSLMNQIESPSTERAMAPTPQQPPTPTQETTPETQTPQTQTQVPPQAGQQGEVAFTWNGKEVKTTWDKAKQWASQGYDYAQKTQALNIERQRFEHEREQFKEIQSRYSEVDKYAKDNPDWWQHVQNSYLQSRQQLDPAAQVPPQILEKLSQYDQFIQEAKQREEAQQTQAEDAALDKDIQSVREKYPDLDWQTPDAQGKSLEYKVLEHAAKNGIRSFGTAFKDFYHDELIKLASERGKEAVNKDVQKRVKAGVLGVSPTPQTGLKQAQNHKNQTYDDLLAEAKAELGIS